MHLLITALTAGLFPVHHTGRFPPNREITRTKATKFFSVSGVEFRSMVMRCVNSAAATGPQDGPIFATDLYASHNIRRTISVMQVNRCHEMNGFSNALTNGINIHSSESNNTFVEVSSLGILFLMYVRHVYHYILFHANLCQQY